MKRLFDLVASLAGLVLLSPLFLLVALLVRAELGSPVLFRQRRATLGGREFTLTKFRTMTDARDAAGQLLPDDQRTGFIGRMLRTTRIDELPELAQIISGDMSLVGPRPLPLSIIEDHPLGPKRLEVRAGLTGLTQVSGNTEVSNAEKFAVDAYYVDKRSFSMDLRILLQTVNVVIFPEKRDEQIIREAMTYAERFDRRGRD